MFCGVNMKRQLLCQLELGPNASVKTLFKGNFSKTPGGNDSDRWTCSVAAARGARGPSRSDCFGRDAGVDGGRWVSSSLRSMAQGVESLFWPSTRG